MSPWNYTLFFIMFVYQNVNFMGAEIFSVLSLYYAKFLELCLPSNKSWEEWSPGLFTAF